MAAPTVACTAIGDGLSGGVVSETSAGRGNFLPDFSDHWHIRNLDAGACSFARLTVDPHAVIGTVQHFHPFVYVTHTDALLEKRSQASLWNPDAVVFHHQMQAAVGQVTANADHAAIHFGGQTVPDAVFDQRLQQHAGHHAVQS